MEIVAEEWRTIEGYEGQYEVSSNGMVRSLDRTIEDKNGVKYRKKGIVLSPGIDSRGYPMVGLGCKKTRNIHTLVALAFLGKRPVGFEINHIDGVKTNNHFNNLEYVSRGDNLRHAYRLGLKEAPRTSGRGESNGYARFTEDQIRQIRTIYNQGVKQKEIASRFGTTQNYISSIVLRKIWTHVA